MSQERLQKYDILENYCGKLALETKNENTEDLIFNKQRVIMKKSNLFSITRIYELLGSKAN